MKKYDMVLVGAGLSNAVIAALNPEKKILVLEKNDIGGMCRTENENGIDVHMYGRHVFHTNYKPAWDFVNRYSEFNGYIHSAKSMIEDRPLDFPINLSVYQTLYQLESPEAVKDLVQENDYDDFESYMATKIGYDLYEKYYKGYTEKFWGMPAKMLPAFIGKRVPIRTSFNNNYFNDRFQGVPIDGYTVMIERMMEHCEILGVDFLSDKEYYESLADTIIYTGSIDEYFDYSLGELPYRSCEYFMSIEPVKDYQGTAQMNFPDPDIPYTRIIEHNHFNPVRAKSTILSTEYPRKWKRGGHLQRFYPIPLQENYNLYEQYMELEHKAIFAGRLGKYTYMNMDQCVIEAMKLNDHLNETL